jgi:hypothetical protein
MDSVAAYVRISHDLENNSLWLLQGDGPDEWFIAHDWQKNHLSAFYTSHQEPAEFTEHGYHYLIRLVPIHEKGALREIIFKNVTTGMVRLVQRCSMEAPIYGHWGCVRDHITLLRMDPDTNEINGQTIPA